jgi:thiamine-phosphate pyrophosphorylase
MKSFRKKQSVMINKTQTDFSLIIILDQEWIQDLDTVKLTKSLIRAGTTMFQYRNKKGSSLEFFTQSDRIHRITGQSHIPLIINDRVDITLAVGAEGVHLGRYDLPAEKARELLGPEKFIGLSVSDESDLDRIKEADYLGVGSLFVTRTKADVRYAGLDMLRKVRSQTMLPVVGIGGIHAGNVDSVIKAGADGAAVISAVLGTENPEDAAREMIERINQIKKDYKYA